MSSELTLLLLTTVSVAFVHTAAGPDHYLPFIVMSKARQWNRAKTAWITFLCGLGHVGSSFVIGLVGVAFGIALFSIKLFESSRGVIAAWVFTIFGFCYLIWGLHRAYKNKTHSHPHVHSDGSLHNHTHTHHDEHSHVHEIEKKVNITPWILFTIFVLGPCEPMIPLVMFPAAKHNYFELFLVSVIFGIITIGTMITFVMTASFGLNVLSFKFIERYTHALAGGTIFACGLGMLFLGL
jgi:nickel/cobalt transporter (NicO) family protein